MGKYFQSACTTCKTNMLKENFPMLVLPPQGLSMKYLWRFLTLDQFKTSFSFEISKNLFWMRNCKSLANATILWVFLHWLSEQYVFVTTTCRKKENNYDVWRTFFETILSNLMRKGKFRFLKKVVHVSSSFYWPILGRPQTNIIIIIIKTN